MLPPGPTRVRFCLARSSGETLRQALERRQKPLGDNELRRYKTMTEASSPTPLSEESAGALSSVAAASSNSWPRAALAALLGLVFLLGVLVAIRPLTRDEAAFLLRVPAAAGVPFSSVGILERIQGAWSHVAGLMERPSRLFGVLATLMIGAIAVFSVTGARTRGSGVRAVFALALLPVLWRDAPAIGSTLPIALGPALALALLSALGLGAAWAARATLLIVAALPFLLVLIAPTAVDGAAADWVVNIDRLRDYRVLAPLGLAPNPNAALIQAGLGFAALLVMVGIGRGKAGFLDGFLVLLVAMSHALCRAGGFVAAPAALVVTSLLPSAAVLAGLPKAPVRGLARNLWILVAVAFVATLFGEVKAGIEPFKARFGGDRFLTPSSPTDVGDRRPLLDWLRTHVDPSTWVVFAGEDRMIDRYYERIGHRTGHATLTIPEDLSIAELASRALILKPPYIVLVDADPAMILALEKRYARATPPEGTPRPLTILAFRTP